MLAYSYMIIFTCYASCIAHKIYLYTVLKNKNCAHYLATYKIDLHE